MIEIFSGVLGASKTCHAVVRICEAFAQGKVVGTNIVLVWDEVASYCRDELDYEVDRDQYILLEDHQIFEFYKHVPRGQKGLHNLIVIDEFPIWFPARSSSDNVQKAAFNWARQSRKDWTDLLIISQRIERVALEFRELTQYYWKFKDMKRTKIIGGIALPCFLELCYDEDRKIIQHRDVKTKNPRWFKLYDTDQMLRPFERPASVTHKGKKIERKLKMWKLVAVLSVFLAAAVATILMRGDKKPEPSVARSAPTPAAPALLPRTVQAERGVPLPHLVRRGFMSGPEGVYLSTNEGVFEMNDETPWGRVVAIGERFVKFNQDGKIVVARVYDPAPKTASQTALSPSVSAAPSPASTPSAPVLPKGGEFYAAQGPSVFYPQDLFQKDPYGLDNENYKVLSKVAHE